MYFIFCLISNDERSTATSRADTHLHESWMSQFKCKYAHRCRHFSPGDRWKNAHPYKPIVCNKRTRGINFSDSVCWHIILYEKLSVKRTEFYTERTHTKRSIIAVVIWFHRCVFASEGPTRIYMHIYIFQRLWCRSVAPGALPETGNFSGLQRQRYKGGKVYFSGGKGRVIGAYRWICIYNRTRVFGWGRGFRRPLAICRAYTYTYIIIYFLRANTRDLYAYISRSHKKWN